MANIEAPQPPQKPKSITTHAEERVDPFYGYRDKTDKEVLQYLKAENTYADRQMADTKELQKTLFAEMKGRIKETDSSVPVRKDNYWYYTRMEEGKEYPIFCRKENVTDAAEHVVLDKNTLAEGHDFLTVGDLEVSPDHLTLAYAVDTNGSEIYTLQFKQIATDKPYEEHVSYVGDFVWAMDSIHLYYTVLERETMRPYRVYRHILGTSPAQDTCIFEESDQRFMVGVERSSDDAYIFIELHSAVTSEVHYMPADGEAKEPYVFWNREHEHEYSVEHAHGVFYVLSNKDAPDFKLLEVPEEDHTQGYERISHRAGRVLEDMEIFRDYVVISEREEGLTRLRVRNIRSGTETWVAPPEELYDLSLDSNPEFHQDTVRLRYSSWITPSRVLDYNMHTGEWTILKEQEVQGGFNSNDYVMERRYVTAEDGAEIPLSLVYHKHIRFRTNNTTWLAGYGSYGIVHPLRFSSHRISLLDRGFIVAFAHIRGGGEKGRQWYEQGKYLQKNNTFSDYITCAEWLVNNDYTSPQKLIAHGGSAGGMLMGVIANRRPDLFHTVIAEVPFVDVLNTMLDTSLPLTVPEFEEWGNPQNYEYYQYIQSYAPYENVKEQVYPHMFVRAGLNDPRVSFWEPAKWVAKLRTHKQDENLLLLRTDMGAGHKGASGRYKALREISEIYAFAIKTLFRKA